MRGKVADLMSGGLRPSDPRRFVIEAMLGAMTADRVVDPREHAVVERRVAEHALFSGLSAEAARTLIELGHDAFRFVGGPVARAPAIARGLSARIHRLVAFGLAAEVAAADGVWHVEEARFLEALRIALRISPLEGEELLVAARAGQLTAHLDDRYARIRALIPLACEVFALRAFARGTPSDDERFSVRDMFASIPDLVLANDELDAALYRSFRRRRAADVQLMPELRNLAQTLPDPVDRYWIVVYVLTAEPPETLSNWRLVPFIGLIQAAFQITDTDLELAVTDAQTFPGAMPRPR